MARAKVEIDSTIFGFLSLTEDTRLRKSSVDRLYTYSLFHASWYILKTRFCTISGKWGASGDFLMFLFEANVGLRAGAIVGPSFIVILLHGI